MEKLYKAETSNIIALCHIIDDFEKFEKRLMSMISAKNNYEFAIELMNISAGKSKLGLRKVKRFYIENKTIIDTINKYSTMPRFIDDYYYFYRNRHGDLRFFYEYILSHKEDIDKILGVLEKLTELNCYKIEFSEDLDFTKETYRFYDFLRPVYLDNIEVIPSYTSDINYKTTSSNYKMELNVSSNSISESGTKITLNSLIFDPERLPKSVKKEDTFEHILKLKKEQKEKTSLIRNSVDLSISVSDLDSMLISVSERISGLDGIQNKNELNEVLLSIRNDVEKLKILSAQYDSSVSEKEPLLTPEILKKEKELCLRRRYDASIDLC